ncbi:MAG TPA: hypothetical protein VMU69_03285 [Bradyrhizobium sp.]|nr:hypothetical protein [Bradyrhizobium sp.]
MVRFVPFVSIIALASVVLASTAFAQVTQREHDACTRDVVRHCRAVMNDGDQAVLACLKQHRPHISRGCEKILVEHGQ